MEIKRMQTAGALRTALAAESGSARAVLSELFDGGTFVELGTYVRRTPDEISTGSESNFEGVITGYGSVDGRLVFAYVQAFEREGGALTEAHAKKICRLYDMALKIRAPIVGVFNSAGAQIMEGVGVLAGYGKILRMQSEAKNEIPQIAVVNGICSGALAAVCTACDFTVMNKAGGCLFVGAPFLLREKEKKQSFGDTAAAVRNGLCAMTGEDTSDSIRQVRLLLSLLPQNSTDGTEVIPTGDDINRTVPEIAGLLATPEYDMRELAFMIADDSKITELYPDYAPEMLTGFLRLNGRAIGIVADNPAEKKGALTAKAAKKAAKLVEFCGRFGLPVLTLVDTEGVEVNTESENAPYSEALAALTTAYASADIPMVTLILGSAIGSAFTFLGSKSIGADVAFAVETAKISSMKPETAVEFVFDREIAEAKDPVGVRAELLDQWNTVLSSPVAAAKEGEIDDIIAADEIRMRLAAAFEMLACGE